MTFKKKPYKTLAHIGAPGMALVFIELILRLYPHEQALLVLVRDDVADVLLVEVDTNAY